MLPCPSSRWDKIDRSTRSLFGSFSRFGWPQKFRIGRGGKIADRFASLEVTIQGDDEFGARMYKMDSSFI